MKQLEPRQLYEMYGHLIFSRCRKLLGCDDRAKDGLQDCMLKLIAHYPKFTDPDHVVPWILRVVKNYCLNDLRSRKKFSDNAVLERLPSSSSTGEFEMQDTIALVLSCHKKDVQDAVYFTYIEELSQEEIRTVTGQSPATIRRNLAKFKESLPQIRKRLGIE